jgi:glucan phosphoethanolaminetransferase (alkaline phosphatase superfamily)
MRGSKLTFLVALVLACPFAFSLARHLESTNQADSLGLWFSLYVAAFFALGFAATVVAFAWVLARVRATRFRVTRQ